jgi:hypothetical protein
MNKYHELAEYIYKRLNDNGAQLGNGSIFIIECAIMQFEEDNKLDTLQSCNQDSATDKLQSCNQ